jgi:hypothetical protein
MTDIESKGSHTVIKEDVENITNVDGTETSTISKYDNDGSVVESTVTNPPFAIAVSTTTSTKFDNPAAHAAAGKKKKNGAKLCLVISTSITGVLAIICFIAMLILPPLFIIGILFAIVCVILGIIQCATGNCCCGAKDD